MTETAVMAMPIRRFWLFSGNVDRIHAQEDLRALAVAASAQDGKSATECQKRLVVELGTVQETDAPETASGEYHPQLEEQRDEAGFNELKMMSRRG